MSVVGMRRFGRQKQKEEGFGSLALVSSTLPVLDVFGSRARTSVYFALAPTDIKCYFAYVCKLVFFVFLCRVNNDWKPGKQGSDLAGVSDGSLSGANTVSLPPHHRQEVT